MVESIAKQLNISLSDIAYIGDDIKCIAVLKGAGFAGVPASAPEYIRTLATVPLQKKGGEGVFREFVERIILEGKSPQEILNVYK